MNSKKLNWASKLLTKTQENLSYYFEEEKQTTKNRFGIILFSAEQT